MLSSCASRPGDYEQLQARPIYKICDYTCMYVLAALEAGRAQLQLLHEWDPCCFRAQGRHPQIRAHGARQILAYTKCLNTRPPSKYVLRALFP